MESRKKVLFIDPVSGTGSVSEGGEDMPSTPNLGILYMAAYIKGRHGVDVSLIDNGIERLTPEGMARAVRKINPDIVGISSKTFNILGAYEAAVAVRGALPGVPILMGGAHPTALPEHTLSERPEVDCIVRREGELTFGEIVGRLVDGIGGEALYKGVKGTTHRAAGGGVVAEEDRELIADLDSLPMPDYSLVDYSRYSRLYNPTKYRFQHIYPIFASRGCPFNCTFCMPLHTRKHRVRSVEKVVDEVEYLHREMGAGRVYFEDSLFCSNRGWFAQFCEAYKYRGLHKKVQWGFETRIDTAFPEMFAMAKEAGCIYSFFGVESGSEEVLKKANKKYARARILEVVGSAKRAGIAEVKMSIIIGLPYETRQTVEQTLSLIEEADCDGAGVNILDAYPGTEVFGMVDRGEGGLRWCEGTRLNWASYNRQGPQLEVNDLTGADLLDARRRALAILRKKRSSSPFAYNMRRLAFFREFLFKNPKRLKKYFMDTLSGTK